VLAEEVDVTWLVVVGAVLVEDEGTGPLEVVDIVPIGPIVCALVTPCPL